MDKLIEFKTLEPILQEYAQQAAEVYKYQISLGGHNASRDLVNTLKTEVRLEDSAYLVTITLNEYWKYVEFGAKGTESSPAGAKFKAHFPPISVLEKWVNIKPILPRYEDRGHIPSPRSLAFLIGRAIKRRGIEPFPALATTKEELNARYLPKMSEALGRDVAQYITDVIRKVEK